MKNLPELLTKLGIHQQPRILKIYNLSIDSRYQSKQWLFLAYQGINSDGNNYINSAIKNGAIVILTDKSDLIQQNFPVPIIYIPNLKDKIPALANWFYDAPSAKLDITAVTGTNGKTSICHLFMQLSTLLGKKTATLGTIGNGIWPKLDTSTHTSPDPVSLQRLLVSFLDKKAKEIILEASSHALEQNRLSALNIHTAIWTNLSHDHLDYHGSMQHYFNAKVKLFDFGSLQSAVINLDDHYAPSLMQHLKNKPINLLTYSLINPNADLFLTDLKPNKSGYSATLIYQNQGYVIHSPLMGKFNLYNLAATILALIANKYDINKIIPLLPNLLPVSGRMQLLNSKNSAPVVIDYAHTPDALENALQTARHHVKNKLWCIFGCGGDRDASKRSKMAEITEKFADRVIVTEDNNRTEDFADILKDIQQGFKHPNQHKVISNRTDAIHFAIDQADVDDLILLCGKGHERYMDKCGKKTYYNEEEIIQSYWDKKA
ncbi:UDP-N-acetylmuramoyl-L-alanyl-D-glutamate--2,6-diaminopimelate ligase [Francisellaceae bacterium]|nr:UDP-N-acetylmuramoyl-L-alanyl-D-glutamate--2,6-diaminopimelate ligase [Francisellaceae bacterium]